jgi:TPR repeat protein
MQFGGTGSRYFPVDTEWALELLEDAANDNDSSAIFELASYYFNEKNNDISFKYFKLAAQLGSPKAQYLLTKYYLEGVFITTDDDDEIDQLINDASAAGVKEALLFKARRMALKSGEQLNQDVISIYEEYADKHPFTPEGLLECA